MSNILKPGDMFLEYRILAVIGEGGMGIVFKAVHEEYEDVVAIKLLSPEQAGRKDFAVRFQQECKFYPKLKHPHIVRMRRAGIAQVFFPDRMPAPVEVAFIVMDLLEGRTLRRILTRYHRLDYLNTLHVMIQIAEAVRFAHLKKIVHRDLKPENIMVGTIGDEKGWVWLMDFGIAKGSTGVRTEDMPDMGTARYMAPEQVRNILSAGKKCARVALDHRTDIYAYGVIFYEVITGRHTFINDEDPPSFEETLTGHLLAEPTPIYKVIPDQDCSPHLEDLWLVIKKCIAVDPSERYQTLDDVLSDVQALIRNSVPATHPLGKRQAAEKANHERRSAFASLPKVPTTVVPKDAEPSGREALPPTPPAAVEAPAPSRDEAPSPEAETVTAWADTDPAPTEEQKTRPEPAHRVTAPLVDYVPEASPLPFRPAAAPFVPSVPLLAPALGVRGTVRMERPDVPLTGASPTSRRAGGTIPMRAAAPAPAGVPINPAPPSEVAFAMAAPALPSWAATATAPPAVAVAQPPAYGAPPPAPAPPAPIPVAPPTVGSPTALAFASGPSTAEATPFSEPERQATSSQPMLSTPSTMSVQSRPSRRHLLWAPLVGLALALAGSAGYYLGVKPRAQDSPAPPGPLPAAPGPSVTADPVASAAVTPPPPEPARDAPAPLASSSTPAPRPKTTPQRAPPGKRPEPARAPSPAPKPTAKSRGPFQVED